MTYNITNFTSSNNFLDMTLASNALVGGWLSLFIILIIFGISFISMKGYSTRHALLVSSFITFILSAAMWGVGFLPERGVVITFVLLLFAVAFSIIGGQD